jgi:RecB family exonuclease
VTAGAVDASEEPMLHPKQFGDIPYPKALSPSAVMEFKKCPQSFLFQYLYKLKQPTSLALAKGSMCHEALEKVFDLEPQDRTLLHLQNLLRVSWGDRRLSDAYRFLFETDSGDRDIDAERTWGQSALKLLENYYQIEDPKTIDRGNPLKREIWLNAHLTVDPTYGTSAAGGGASPSKGTTPTFHVRGIVDRLDMVRVSPRQVAMRIVDYKTGKAPNLKYSKPVNDRIMEEAFYQLKIYALLLREKGAGAAQPKGMDLRLLRLLFLTSEQGRAQNLDFDLGETQEQRDMVLQEVHQDLSNVWTEITELVSHQDPKAFVGCDRSFCYCHKCRERFVPDSVWEPN